MTQAEIIKALTAEIDRGELKFGDRLKTTRELAEKYGTTQQTVATALSIMAGMGMVQVSRGWGTKVITGKPRKIKLGTFLSANEEVPTGATSWTKDTGTGAKETPSVVTQIVTTEADGDTGIPVGSHVVERSRTRFDPDEAPCQHKRTLVTVDMATLTPEGWTGLPPMMSPEDHAPPAGMSLAKWLGMGVERVLYDICTAPATEKASAALKLPNGTPCLRIVSRGVRADGTVAYATVTTAPLRTSISLEIKDGVGSEEGESS